MIDGQVRSACGFIGLACEAGPEVAYPAGTSPLHDAYPLLYSALPGGKYREGRISEPQARQNTVAKTPFTLASPAASTKDFAPPVLGVESFAPPVLGVEEAKETKDGA